MDLLKSMKKTRKKSNSKDKTEKVSKVKKPEASAKVKKKPSERGVAKSSRSTRKKAKSKQKSKREKKESEPPAKDNSNLAINIFDQTTFTFRIEACIHPEPSNHNQNQTLAYESFAACILSSGVEGLIKEYTEELVKFIPTGFLERTVFDQNTELKKNRYKDVICNDKTRVILKDGRPGDYIHANYLKGSKPLYILTQGPLKDSQMDMWRMVLQEKVAAICMLCELVENGRPKCEPYFPDSVGQTLTFEDITVTCNEYTCPDVHTQLKWITVVDKKNNKTHKLQHFKIVTWPDKTIPQSNLSVLRTHRILRKLSGPVVVHCSAGVGRTGTFAAIEIGVQCLLNGKSFRPVDLVKALRHCRLHSVQMDTQYLMLVEAILDSGVAFKYIENQKILDAIETYKRQTADYVEAHPPPMEWVKTPKKNSKEAAKDSEDPAPAPSSPPPPVQPPQPAAALYPLQSARGPPNPEPPPPTSPTVQTPPAKSPAAKVQAAPLPPPQTETPGKGQSVHVCLIEQQPRLNYNPGNSQYL